MASGRGSTAPDQEDGAAAWTQRRATKEAERPTSNYQVRFLVWPNISRIEIGRYLVRPRGLESPEPYIGFYSYNRKEKNLNDAIEGDLWYHSIYDIMIFWFHCIITPQISLFMIFHYLWYHDLKLWYNELVGVTLCMITKTVTFFELVLLLYSCSAIRRFLCPLPIQLPWVLLPYSGFRCISTGIGIVSKKRYRTFPM